MWKRVLSVGLLPWVLAAIVLGVLCGQFFPAWLTRIFVTFNGLFGQFLGFMVPLLMVGLIAPGIADLGKKSIKLLVYTVLLSYGFMVLAGLFTYGVAALWYPYLIRPLDTMIAFSAPQELRAYFSVPVTPLMNVTASMVFAFVLGLGASALKDRYTLRNLLVDFREVIYKVISYVIIPLLPLYVFSVFLNMTVLGQTAAVLGIFAKIIVLIFIITVVYLAFQFAVAGTLTGQEPADMIKVMLPAYFTALGTASSAATIPVTYRQVQELGVRESVAGLTVPLCANIHMAGSAIKIIACAMVIVLLTGGHLHFWQFAGVVCMLALAILAGQGVPGGAVMASLGVIQSMLGFTEPMLGLMVALYLAMDSFGTACNVTGDGAIAVIINWAYREK